MQSTDIELPLAATCEPPYGSLEWITFKVQRAESDLTDVAYFLWKESLALGLSFPATIRRYRDMGAGITVADRTLYRRLENILEYQQHQEAKRLNPSPDAARKRVTQGYKSTPDICHRDIYPLQNATNAIPDLKAADVESDSSGSFEDIEPRFKPGFAGATGAELVEYIYELEHDLERVEAALYKLERSDTMPVGVALKPGDIASMASYLARVKPKTQTQIKREEKKRRVALATIQIDPLEMGYENAKLRAENERLRHEVERLKPVPIDADKLGSREVKGLAQRLGLNQNLSTEETRDLVREALANRDNLIKARQLLGQTEVEVLKAKITEQQELLKLWELSHQYTLGQRDTPWSVLGLRELEGIEYNRPRYRKLIEFWHPDRNKLPIATEMTAKINKAWTAYCGTFN